MAEIKKFVHHGASQVNQRILEGIHKNLPMLKIEFARIDAPKFPHLVEQLEFLADVIEDFMEGADKDVPLGAVAEAAFALAYVHKQTDLIPDSIPGMGYADDSSVVRCVLMENERILKEYAIRHDLEWDNVTVKP
ncbi:MAG: hypothetical protein CMO80_18415 [Verrucomicrobiales bacterium]|nr:hypothetical protein [Verrucomicrobiales bacterium]|tara:strand:+ start:105 stop:509 length:405 start_codon:yes stop_codon:yes gene_type:complete